MHFIEASSIVIIAAATIAGCVLLFGTRSGLAISFALAATTAALWIAAVAILTL